MQQYSSLPEQNSQIDATPTLLTTIQQLSAELWLERSLNQLQNRLNDCLGSIVTTNNHAGVSEAEIFQTVVDELHRALSPIKVAIAIVQPQQKVCKVCYLSGSPSQPSQTPSPEVMGNKEKKPQMRLEELINIEDLQSQENQQPPIAWHLSDNTGIVIGWLMLTTAPIVSDSESLEGKCAALTSQLMVRAAQQCSTAIAQLKHRESLQQRCQQLESINQNLERTNQLKNQFLANTSHEIRTPLSSIIGFTYLLLAKGYDPSQERHQEYLNIIQSSGKHLLALINDILDLSKIEANQLEVQFELVDISTLCLNVMALVKEKAADKGLKLSIDLNPSATSLVADPLRLKQMLLNLLFNALKFTSTGTVGLQVKPNGSFMHFTVWDTGTGISREKQTDLFQPYFQIANSTAGSDEGTGLGLAVTRKLAELHGGWVEVESEVEHGSRFTIVLPLRQGEGEGDSESSIHGYTGERNASSDHNSVILSSSVTENSSPNILLVEDDLPNAQMMETYLRKLGYQVTWVKNAAEMWEALKHLHPAVILMDIRLPDSNGFNLVKQLREHQQYQMIPIIAQTAMAMKGDRETCLAAGINDYISKPIDLPRLATLVSKYSKPRGE